MNLVFGPCPERNLHMHASPDFISIIMPAYNAERTISVSINSVISQTWQDWELIIIDDCSTDRTAHIICKYESSDTRIRHIRNSQNSGVASSRNTGLLQAQGVWIAFLDSDDCWEPNKLALQLDFAHHMQANFTFTGSAFMDQDGRRLSHQLNVPLEVTFHQLLKQNIISCSSVLVRTELMLRYPMGADHMHEDFAVWLQILRDNRLKAYGLNQPLLIYRLSASSKSGNKLKAARMTFRVYRYIGLSYPSAFYYWCWYTVRSLSKYRKIKQFGLAQ